MPLIRDLSDAELLAEWHLWDNRIKNAQSWGASLAAADSFRKSCEQQLRLRNIPVPTESQN